MSPEQQAALKPCPCCDSGAVFQQITDVDSDDFAAEFIECIACGITTDLMMPCMEDVKALLAEKWNRRTTPPPAAPGEITQEQMVEALQDAWNDFCDDAQAHPDCFWRERGKMFADFGRGNFAQMVLEHLTAVRASAALAGVPRA